MKAILCPICEVDRTEIVNRRRRQGITVTTVICRGCGLVYHNPVIEDRDRQEAQASHQKWHTDARPTPRYLRKLEDRWTRQWPLIQPVFTPGARVLEFGSGLGVVSGHLKNLGARVLCIEPDPDQADFARRRFGLTVLTGRFEEVDLAGEQFDLIFSSHVIEHFPDPLNFLVKELKSANLKTRRPSRLPWRDRPSLRLDYLRADTASIRTLYRHYGFLDTRVHWELRSSRDPSAAVVVFVIDGGAALESGPRRTERRE